MSDHIPMTEEGYAALNQELDHLINVRRPEVIQAIAMAREEGDLTENAGYDAAKHDQAMIERRIQELEQQIRRAQIINKSTNSSTVQLGSTVTIEIDGEAETYTIVGAVEAKPAQGRISNESPIGKALLGKRVGESVDIETPTMTINARIVQIDAIEE